MQFLRHLLVASIAVSPLLAAEPNPAADALRERIVAHAGTVSAEDYAYTRTVRAEQTGGDKTEEKVVVEHWNPTKPADQRWTLASVDGRTPTADELKDYTKNLPKRRQTGYGRVAGYFANPSTTEIDARGRTVFRLAALPKETLIVADADISGNATGEAIVNASSATPFIEEVRFRSTKPSRVKLVMKIDRFETMTRYRLMPDGKPVAIEQTSEMNGSMLGQQGTIRTRIAYTDHRAVAKK